MMEKIYIHLYRNKHSIDTCILNTSHNELLTSASLRYQRLYIVTKAQMTVYVDPV